MIEVNMEPLAKGGEFVVLVPSEKSPLRVVIAAGSAVVMARKSWETLVRGEEGLPVAYYEGAIYSHTPTSYADKLLHAAGRAKQNYPTVAKVGVIAADSMVEVGYYDYETHCFWPHGDAGVTALINWGVEVGDVGLSTASGRLAAARSGGGVAFYHERIGGHDLIVVEAGASGVEAAQKLMAGVRSAPASFNPRFCQLTE